MEKHIEELLLEKLNAAAPAPAPALREVSVRVFDRETAASRSREIEEHIPRMDALRDNPSERPLPDPPGLAGRVRSFFRSIVRKLIRWYIKPVAVQQTLFNNEVTPTLGCMAELHRTELAALTELETLTEQNEKQLLRIDAALEDDRERADRMERSLRYLPEQLRSLLEAQNERIALAECTLSEEECRRLLLEERLAAAENALAENAALRERLTALEEKTDAIRTLSLSSEEAIRSLTDAGAPTCGVSASERYMQEGSQAGEDKIIRHITSCLGIEDRACTYLDLGANHAKELSNTWYFYSRGARGVLVEANPALIAELKLYRGEDVILNRCIAARSGEKIPFFVMSGDGLSTSDRESAEAFLRENPALSLERTVEVETVTVSELMERYFDPAPVILNVDIEGREEAVLREIDWAHCRPAVVIAEMIPYRATLYVEGRNESIRSFMAEQGYREYAFTGINSVFLDMRRVEGQR